MITGEFNSLAVSRTALIESLPITLTAGRANCLAFANLKISCTSSPVATPELIVFTMLKILERKDNETTEIRKRKFTVYEFSQFLSRSEMLDFDITCVYEILETNLERVPNTNV